MKNIFNTLTYVKEKLLLSDCMNDWAYNATKDMISRCEEELKKRYGSVDAVDYFAYELSEVNEIFTLVDNEITDLPQPLRDKLQKHLFQELCFRLDDISERCAEIDEYFENDGKERAEDSENFTVIIDDIGEYGK